MDRLRRDPGRRRHPLRGHLRRLRRHAYGPRSGSSPAGRCRTCRCRDWSPAVSVGIVDAEPLLDPPYAEDSRAEVDGNVVMTGNGELIEVQATAERTPFGARVARPAAGAGRGRHRDDRPRAGPGALRRVSGRPIVLASGNAHKALELPRVLPGWTVLPFAGELPEETGDTFVANALLKAARRAPGDRRRGVGAGRRLRHRGSRPCRGAGRALGPLRRRGCDRRPRTCRAARRGARRRRSPRRATSPSSSRSRPTAASCTPAASCTARSRPPPRGSGGFGYDPAVVPEGETRTVAEMSPDEKDVVSHRALAAAALLPQLPS